MILTAPCPLAYIGIAIGAIIFGFIVFAGMKGVISRVLRWRALR